jgi:hypothetical protein
VWHLCARNKSASFLCPTGTLFNQAAMICDRWDNVPQCDLAPQLYYLNSLFLDIFLAATETSEGSSSSSSATKKNNVRNTNKLEERIHRHGDRQVEKKTKNLSNKIIPKYLLERRVTEGNKVKRRSIEVFSADQQKFIARVRG